jgi:hypothetical protein
MDNELQQLKVCMEAFGTLTREEAERVSWYLRDRFVGHARPMMAAQGPTVAKGEGTER